MDLLILEVELAANKLVLGATGRNYPLFLNMNIKNSGINSTCKFYLVFGWLVGVWIGFNILLCYIYDYITSFIAANKSYIHEGCISFLKGEKNYTQTKSLIMMNILG